MHIRNNELRLVQGDTEDGLHEGVKGAWMAGRLLGSLTPLLPSPSLFPQLTGGGHSFGGGASAGALSVIAGRLLCDTYLSARELVKEVDYTLRTLARCGH